MWWDNYGLETDLANPTLSKEAAVTGYDELPCPAFNQTCLLSAPWGMYINPNISTAQKDAAWQLMEYLTTPQNQITAMDTTRNPALASRTASLTYALSHNSIFKAPTDFLAGMRYALDHIEPNAIPVTPAFTPMVGEINVTLSALVAAELTPQQALTGLQSEMLATVKQYHL